MSTPTPRVQRVDPADESALAEWYRVLCKALEEDRDGSAPALPLSDIREVLAAEGQALACVSLEGDGSPAGALLVECGEEDTDTLEIDIAVLPEVRRRGHGSALLRESERIAAETGRSVQVVEVSASPDRDPASGAGGGFALAHGFEAAGMEDLHVLDLPLPGAVLAVLEKRARSEEGGPEVTGWQDVCPDELVVPCARLRLALEREPADGSAQAPPDGAGPAAPEGPDGTQEYAEYAELVRGAEAWRAEKGVHSLVSVALDASGRAVGLSELVLMPGADAADQAGTLVLPEYRGRGLGSRLWLRNLTELARAFPEYKHVRTWTSPEDTATRELVRGMGFRTVERIFALERALPVP